MPARGATARGVLGGASGDDCPERCYFLVVLSRHSRVPRRLIAGTGLQHRVLASLGALWFLDALAWLVAVLVATWIRQDLSWTTVQLGSALRSATVAAVLHFVFYLIAGRVRGRPEYGSLDELIRVQCVAGVAAACLFLSTLRRPEILGPRSVPVIAFFVASTLLCCVRIVKRVAQRVSDRPVAGAPTVIVGAGAAGRRVVRLMSSNPRSLHLPVGLVDDDSSLVGMRIEGVRVCGTVDDLPRVMRELGSSTVVVAVPSAGSDFLGRVLGLVRGRGIEVLRLPSVNELFGVVRLDDIQRIKPEDLLPREGVSFPMDDVAGLIRGKRILVTGAGGSIGSEIVRQVAGHHPEALFMLDRDESALHATQLSVDGRALLDSEQLVLADIRESERLIEVFRALRPDVVFHAAALKHLTLLERSPREAWKTNVVGTLNVLEAVEDAGVACLVNISTDKAADPISVLGLSKLIGERLVAGYGGHDGRRCLSVRFGNVLGSRGSVLTTFAEQARRGSEIVVTDPEVTRYFMTIEEAVRLTLVAGAMGTDRSTLVLDMGDPVRIMDVALRFARSVEPNLPVVFSGLRPGEKMTEILVGVQEEVIGHVAEKILEIWPGALNPSLVKGTQPARDDLARSAMLDLVSRSLAQPRPLA
jgi:FlaA1/EpsC-like NDP-sugar epimerase